MIDSGLGGPGASLRFWQHLSVLAADARLVIDRPRGTAHPRYPGFIYPLDYGYLEGTTAADGGGIDAYLGSLRPAEVEGVIVTVDLLKRDAEIKILLGCTAEEMRSALATHDAAMQAATLLLRPVRGAPGGGSAVE